MSIKIANCPENVPMDKWYRTILYNLCNAFTVTEEWPIMKEITLCLALLPWRGVLCLYSTPIPRRGR